MNVPITILTSLFPSRLEEQQKAVNSWFELGFKVVSFNLVDELSNVEPFFRNVIFLTVNRQADDKIGTRIYLNEFFEGINSLPGSLFGIVNSDIVFMAGSDFQDFISRQVANSMLFGSRVDTDPSKSGHEKEYPFGFDYFFFSKDFSQGSFVPDFCLGMPLWDYWLPLSAAVNGFSLKKIISPIALHVKHEESWSEAQNDAYWPLIGMSVKDWLKHGRKDTSALWTLLPFIKDDWRNCSYLITNYLKYETDSIFYTTPDETQCLVKIHESSYSGMKIDLSLLAGKCKEMELNLLTFKNSRSWRITEPLRTIMSFCRNRSISLKKDRKL